MELTQIQREILTALINLQRRTGRAIKGEEIASTIDRNPGTIRNQMQSLKAIHLVEGVPGPKGGYRAIAAAYDAINLDADDQVVCLVRGSASGRVFSIWESVVGGSWYGATDLSGADCPAAAPGGYELGGF